MRKAVGAQIQGAVSERLVLVQQRQRIRLQHGLQLELRMHGQVVPRPALVAALAQQGRALRRRQQRQGAQRRVGGARHRLHQGAQLFQYQARAGGVKAGARIVGMQGQSAILHHGQGPGIIGLLALAGHAEAQFCLFGGTQGGIDGVILEHDDAVEQGDAALPRPALHLVQRRMLEFAPCQVLRLQLAQPLAHGCARLGSGDHGQGIDEHAEQAVGARQGRRTAGHGGAKGHARLPRIALQQQQPGALHHGVDGDARLPREGGQAGHRRRFQAQADAVLAGSTRGTRWHRQRQRQARGRCQRRQLRAPERFAGGAILPLQPGDVVAVASRHRHMRFAVVVAQQLAHQARTAPAIEQQMVAGPDEMVA
ncbi:hypothetical protein JANLI_04380 [Janthinobacterium lividum]|nr:hypothetical protein JANLI_04380 [Janthinobacterium lividum]